jgi:hypothetical protein
LAGQVFPFTSFTNYNATGTTLGFLNGFFSTASSTQSGNFFLPSLAQGGLYTGSNGLVSTFATTTASCSGSASCSSFTIIGGTPITITATGGGVGGGSWATTTITGSSNYFNYSLNATDVVGIGSTAGTSTSKFWFDPNLSASFLSYASSTGWSSIYASTTNLVVNGESFNDLTGDGLVISGNSLTTTLGTAVDISAETNLTAGVGLTLTDDDVFCDTANTSTFGCLTSTDWNTFNAKLSSYDAWTHPSLGISATSTKIFGIGTTTPTLNGLTIASRPSSLTELVSHLGSPETLEEIYTSQLPLWLVLPLHQSALLKSQEVALEQLQ